VRHPAEGVYRAIASMTFQFGAPYFIKKIDYDARRWKPRDWMRPRNNAPPRTSPT